MLGNAPNVYIYACNNPSESLLAKRRGFATITSHLVPPYSRASLYKELSNVKDLIADYRSELLGDKKQKSFDIISILYKAIVNAGLFTDFPYNGTEPIPAEITKATANTEISASSYNDKFIKEFTDYIISMNTYLAILENRLFSEGLHILGNQLSEHQIAGYLDAIVGNGLSDQSPLTPEMNKMILNGVMNRKSINEIVFQISSNNSALINSKSGVDWIRDGFTLEDKFSWSLLIGDGSDSDDLLSRINDWFKFQLQRLLRDWGSKEADEYITNYIAISPWVLKSSVSRDKKGGSNLLDVITLAKKLYENSASEMDYLIRAISGEYIESAPGGDIIRDGIATLPTGRNIYSLDPYRIPSQLAIQRGKEAALLILQQHVLKNQEYPETVAVTLWGLDTIKTKGESIGILLELIGADVIREGTGRVVAFKLLPIEEIGHPRIDVLASLSGIFRDSFGNILDLLDDVIQDAADASDEDNSNNYIKKHANELKQKGVDKPTARLFSNPPGEFGSMVNEQIGSGEWKESNELGNTWETRNSFSYGKGNEKGIARPEVLSLLLSKTDRIIQEIDSVEYGLTDIQEYFANTGALKKAAENNKLKYERNKVNVDVSIIETFDKQVKAQELQDVLRMEYRSKLLNPKWSDAMIKQGASGVYEISSRMNTLIGWSSTADFNDKYVYDTACERYVLDEAMKKKMKVLNPEGFRNIIKRMLEANGRNFWKPSEEILMQLKDLYDEIEDEIEGM